MCKKTMVGVFLLQRRIQPSEIRSIQARMKHVAPMDDIFSAGRLEFIMGDEQLAQAFRETIRDKPVPAPEWEEKHRTKESLFNGG